MLSAVVAVLNVAKHRLYELWMMQALPKDRPELENAVSATALTDWYCDYVLLTRISCLLVCILSRRKELPSEAPGEKPVFIYRKASTASVGLPKLVTHPQIGNGSFGHVYKAYDNTLKNDCAVKVRTTQPSRERIAA